MIMLKVSHRFANANHENTREKKLYCNILNLRCGEPRIRKYPPVPECVGRSCEWNHGQTYRMRRSGRGHTVWGVVSWRQKTIARRSIVPRKPQMNHWAIVGVGQSILQLFRVHLFLPCLVWHKSRSSDHPPLQQARSTKYDPQLKKAISWIIDKPRKTKTNPGTCSW